jgi:hypothetical protein
MSRQSSSSNNNGALPPPSVNQLFLFPLDVQESLLFQLLTCKDLNVLTITCIRYNGLEVLARYKDGDTFHCAKTRFHAAKIAADKEAAAQAGVAYDGYDNDDDFMRCYNSYSSFPTLSPLAFREEFQCCKYPACKLRECDSCKLLQCATCWFSWDKNGKRMYMANSSASQACYVHNGVHRVRCGTCLDCVVVCMHCQRSSCPQMFTSWYSNSEDDDAGEQGGERIRRRPPKDREAMCVLCKHNEMGSNHSSNGCPICAANVREAKRKVTFRNEMRRLKN